MEILRRRSTSVNTAFVLAQGIWNATARAPSILIGSANTRKMRRKVRRKKLNAVTQMKNLLQKLTNLVSTTCPDYPRPYQARPSRKIDLEKLNIYKKNLTLKILHVHFTFKSSTADALLVPTKMRSLMMLPFFRGDVQSARNFDDASHDETHPILHLLDNLLQSLMKSSFHPHWRIVFWSMP